MATKLALLSFEFEKLDNNLAYDPSYQYDFSSQDPSPGEGVQPVIEEAFGRIRKCLEKSVSNLFHFGQNSIQNLNNHLHLATTLISAAVQHADGTIGQTLIILIVKFYRLDPNNSYQVSIDLEELPSSHTRANSLSSFKHGTIDYKNIKKLAILLDGEFGLNKKIEFTPTIKRGRTNEPHYLRSTSDERLLEYDFEQLLFHKQSEFQDVKILRSPSLGNMLLLDNAQSFAEVDISYIRALMDYGNVCYSNRDILILGGGDGGLLWELLKECPKSVTLVEIDPIVIEASREHLRPYGQLFESFHGNKDNNYHGHPTNSVYEIIVDDCLKVLRQKVLSGKKYHVILNDLTMRPVCKRQESLTAFDANAVQKDNEWHFIESIFNSSMQCLEPNRGVYTNRATSKSNEKSILAYEDFLKKSNYELFYDKRFAYVPSRMEIEAFYTIQRMK